MIPSIYNQDKYYGIITEIDDCRLWGAWKVIYDKEKDKNILKMNYIENNYTVQYASTVNYEIIESPVNLNILVEEE